MMGVVGDTCWFRVKPGGMRWGARGQAGYPVLIVSFSVLVRVWVDSQCLTGVFDG